jgi:hypothetical protein
VLLDTFLWSPVCGNEVNCTGNGLGDITRSRSAAEQRIISQGLPSVAAALLLRQLKTFRGTSVYPVYSMRQDTIGQFTGPYNGIMSCASLPQLAVFGTCKPGPQAVEANTMNVYGDTRPTPRRTSSTRAILPCRRTSAGSTCSLC